MIFQRLELKNFKSHEDTVLNFDKGITLIVGGNGAGKSSILEAITFALFTHSEVKTQSQLVRTNKGITGKTEMEVNLTFKTTNGVYRVERKVVRTTKPSKDSKKNKESVKSDSELYEIIDSRKRKIASSVKEVNEEIKRILMMDSTTFLSAIHVRQGQISKLIDEAPHKRKELIGQLLKLDDLKKAHENIRWVIQEVKSDIKHADEDIKPPKELDSMLDEANSQNEELQNKEKILYGNLEGMENNLKTHSEIKEQLDQIKEKYDGFKTSLEFKQKELETLNNYHQELAKKLLSISENETEIETLRPCTEKFKRFTEFKDNYQKYNSLKIEENAKSQIIEENDKHKGTIEKEKENNDRFLELSGEIEELEKTTQSLAFEIGQLADLEKRKNDAKGEIDRYANQLNDFYTNSITALNDLDLDCKTDDVSLDELEDIISGYIVAIEEEAKKIESELEVHQNEIIRLNHEIDSTDESLEDIKKVDSKCPTCQSEITEAKKAELISTYENTISTDSGKITEINVLVEDLKAKKSIKDNAVSQLTSIKNKIDSNRIIWDNIGKMNGEIEEIDKKITEIESKKSDCIELKSQLEEKQNEHKALEESHKAYDVANALIKSDEEEAQIRSQLSGLSTAIHEIEKTLENLIELEPDLSLEITDDELNEQIDILNDKNNRFIYLEGLINDKEEFENKLKVNEGEIQTKTASIEEIKRAIEECNYDEEKHNDINEMVEKFRESVNALNISLIEVQKDLQINQNDINLIKSAIEENNKNIKKHEALDDYVKLLTDFRMLYGKDGIQKDLRKQHRDAIQVYARRFFEKFNFNYSDLTLNDEYDITITGPEGLATLDMVSGGEKIAIALSLRLAITQVMSKGDIETILLDEPTIHLDSFRKQELINVLRSMAIIPQMIIVTHDDELENAADYIIKLKKVDGISRVEQV